jgi:Asp-tRNA(Asn)/Glu-tRNA(Gln) amidotransferase A subunit family amidase
VTTAHRIDATELNYGGKTYDLKAVPAPNLLLRNCGPQNFTGLPSVSIPIGRASSGMPIGFQLVGNHFDDMRLLGIAQAVETLVGYDDVAPWFMPQEAAVTA